MMRANQGHSLDVDLKLAPQKPPRELYHGTATRFLDSIFTTGLQKRDRKHVHLSLHRETAVEVGKRHGKPVMLTINAEQMHSEAKIFYLSANGVWLTNNVDPKFIDVS